MGTSDKLAPAKVIEKKILKYKVQMNKVIFTFLFSSILIYSCNDSTNKLIVTSQKDIVDTISNVDSIVVSDTIILVKGNSYIIAYSLSQKEYDNLSETVSSEYDEGYSDMIFYLGQFAKTSKNKDIAIQETASAYLKIHDSIIDRRAIGSDFGLIFISKTGTYEVVNNGLLDNEIEKKVDSMLQLLVK